MPKKRILTDEEKALFAAAMKGVTPLSKKNISVALQKTPLLAKKSNQTVAPSSILNQPSSPFYRDEMDEDNWIMGEDIIQFHRGGLQDRVLKKLSRGEFPMEATLDLHQLTIAEAVTKTERFIQEAQAKNKRGLLIIHGKGFKKPILKNMLNIWLRKQPAVLAFHSAKPKDGGTGALYVIIQRHSAI